MNKQAGKPAICLVCWSEVSAAGHAASLKHDGFQVTVADPKISAWIGYFRDLLVDAVVIDLDRLPSHGREVGIVLRGSKWTRDLPLIYLGGVPEKIERLRQELPDALYGDWSEARESILRAMANPMERTSRPTPAIVRSRDSDLARRLGLTADVEVVTWGDAGFLFKLLEPLPEGVTIASHDEMNHRRPGKSEPASRLWLCVTRTADEVRCAFDRLTTDAHRRLSAWIIHPKQTSRYPVDFNQNGVRDAGLARGWVDFKVCAVDQDWSGLKFAPRKTVVTSQPRTMKKATGKTTLPKR